MKKRKEVTKKEVKREKPKVATKKEVVTNIRYLPISPRKLRLVAEAVKGLSPVVALERLAVVNKKGGRILEKAIKSAISNAENNLGLKRESLRFKEILVNEGPRLKRRDKSHGERFSFGLIKKRRSHLRIVIEGEEE